MTSANSEVNRETAWHFSPTALMQMPKNTENRIRGRRSPFAIAAMTLLGTSPTRVLSTPLNALPS